MPILDRTRSDLLSDATRTPLRAAGKQHHGTAVVEMAVVLPLFVLLVIGAIDVGRAIMVRQTLVEASRAGCRLYCVNKELTQQDASDLIEDVMEEAQLPDYSIEFDPASSDDIEHKAPVTVSVSIPFDQVSWLKSWYLSGTTLTGTCIMPGDTGEVDLAEDPEPPPADDDDDDDDDDDWGRGRPWWR